MPVVCGSLSLKYLWYSVVSVVSVVSVYPIHPLLPPKSNMICRNQWKQSKWYPTHWTKSALLRLWRFFHPGQPFPSIQRTVSSKSRCSLTSCKHHSWELTKKETRIQHTAHAHHMIVKMTPRAQHVSPLAVHCGCSHIARFTVFFAKREELLHARLLLVINACLTRNSNGRISGNWLTVQFDGCAGFASNWEVGGRGELTAAGLVINRINSFINRVMFSRYSHSSALSRRQPFICQPHYR